MLARNFCDSTGLVLPSKHFHSVEITLQTGVINLGNVKLVLCSNQIFSGFEQQTSTPAPPPGSVASLTAQVQIPKTVQAGSRLRYVVMLTNNTNTPVALSPCPVYQESVFATNAPTQLILHTLQLNCSDIHAILPHSKVSYHMVISVPSETGEAKFGWHIGPGGPYSGSVLTIISG